MRNTSQIADDTATAVLAIFAGQTVHRDEIGAQIELQYAAARKRTAVGSFFQVFDAIERAGVTCRYTGPDFTGEAFYTFPAIDLDASAA